MASKSSILKAKGGLQKRLDIFNLGQSFGDFLFSEFDGIFQDGLYIMLAPHALVFLELGFLPQ